MEVSSIQRRPQIGRRTGGHHVEPDMVVGSVMVVGVARPAANNRRAIDIRWGECRAVTCSMESTMHAKHARAGT